MKQTVKLLACPEDREALAPILAALEEKGVRAAEAAGPAGKKDVVLAALSTRFYADEGLTGRLLSLVGSEAENILPLQLDDTPVPDTLKNALYARNIIPAAGRDASLLAERIAAALPQKKSRLPVILGAAALALAAAVGLLLWKSRAPAAVETIAPEPLDPTIYLPSGLTQEDLSRIVDVVIVGERIELYREDEIGEVGFVTNGDAVMADSYHTLDSFAYRTWDENAGHFYDMDDGHEYHLTRYEDLRFLGYLPNLRFLSLALVDADSAALPDLRGAEALDFVYLMDCQIPDLDWLSGSSVTGMEINNTTGSLRDFGPLTECEALGYLYIDLSHTAQADFSAFAPPAMECLFIDNGQELRSLDLSALSGCAIMNDLNLTELPVTDLSFLRSMPGMKELRLTTLRQLRDISAVAELKNLTALTIEYCPRITDYTPIAGCTALERVHFQCDDNPDAMRDASFLADLPKLQSIGLYSCNLRNMDFLEKIGQRGTVLSLGFAGGIQDYSGLAAIKHFSYLHVNPRGHAGNRGGDFPAVQPYIQDAQVDYLMLYECGDVDLSALPDGVAILSIRYGDLADLSGLKPYRLDRLELWDCQYLTSLRGLEVLPSPSAGYGGAELEIVACPRLTDYSALDGASLSGLKLCGVYALPDLSGVSAAYLHLESIEDLADLHCLDALNAQRRYDSISLVGLENVQDLSPVARLQVDHLTVPPQLAEQAEELVADGRIQSYRVAYPDGSWQPFNGEIELLSLDELDTLPKALLRRVTRLCIAGDSLRSMGDVWEQWTEGEDTSTLMFHTWSTDEQTPLGDGVGVVTDPGMLLDLTGLWELRLYAQPLETLDGIQNLASLENLTAAYCPALTDVSAAFACPELRWLDLYNSPIDSIRGVQNLPSLLQLNINETNVSDLSPLAELDYTAATEEGGFRLYMSNIPAEDYSALAAIPVLDNLDINNVEAERVLPYLENTEIHRLGACGIFMPDSKADNDAMFKDFVAAHPQLTELAIPWNPGLTDLTPLLTLENLEYVRLSFNMEAAIASLDGQSFGFELEIEG